VYKRQLSLRARQLAGEQKWAEAVARYREAVSLVPKDAGAHNDLGMALLREGKSAEAAAEFDRALEIDPANQSAKANRELAAHGR